VAAEAGSMNDDQGKGCVKKALTQHLPFMIKPLVTAKNVLTAK
jgi:hypothetical protein